MRRTMKSKAKTYKFDPDWVVPTWVVLKEWLDKFGLSTRIAACSRYAKGDARDWAASILDDVLADKPFHPKTAEVLAAVTDVSEGFWRSFEHNYRTGLAAGKTNAWAEGGDEGRTDGHG